MGEIVARRARIPDFLAIAKLDRTAWGDSPKSEFVPDGEHAWRVWVEHSSVYTAFQGTEVAKVSCKITTAPYNTAMLRLCEKYGFEKVALVESYYRKGEDRYLLNRKA